jgi:hypothetical protein
MNLSELKHRYDIGDYLSKNGLNGEIVEVGVAYGQNAKLVLDEWKGEKMYLVDPYVKQDISQYASNMDNVDFDEMLKWATEHLEPHKGRFEFIRKFSNEAVSHFEDNSLDMVYLDGNHQNPVFENDFKSWLPKVKIGGILGGHDYMDLDTPSYKCDVKKTVDELCYYNGYKFHLTNDDDSVQSWWIQL